MPNRILTKKQMRREVERIAREQAMAAKLSKADTARLVAAVKRGMCV